MNDMTIFSLFLDNHLQNVKIVISELRKPEILLNLGKCCTITDNIKYLRRMIHAGVQTTDEALIKCFDKLQNPRECNATQIYSQVPQPSLTLCPVLHYHWDSTSKVSMHRASDELPVALATGRQGLWKSHYVHFFETNTGTSKLSTSDCFGHVC